MADLTNGYDEELSRADVNTSAENADAADAADFSVAENAVESEVQTASDVQMAEERTTEEQTEAINAAEKSPTAPPRAEKNPFDRDGFHGEVVTEAVVHEHKLPKSSEKSATIEAAEAIVAEGEMTDSEYIAGLKPVIHYHLSDFDGPLDLLLELIKDAKIRIEDIFVSDVTRQYVEIIKNTPKEEFDFEYAGEFITLAAELVYLKSLRTLPADDEDEEYYDDPEMQRAALINKIKEYALMKEQSEKLRAIETINRFYRMPVYTEKDYRVCLTNFSLPKLVSALARVMVNAEQRERSFIPKKVMQDKFSVAEQMQHIVELISLYGSFTFTSLFEPDFDRNDIVTTFLAVLELLKYGRLRAEQEELFGEIMLYAVEGADETPLVFEEENDGKY